MVYNGFGVWALVWQVLTSAVVNTAVLWYTAGLEWVGVFLLNKIIATKLAINELPTIASKPKKVETI